MATKKLTAVPIGNLENFRRERHIFDLFFSKGMGRLSVITPSIFRVQYTVQKNWTYKPHLAIEEKEWKSVPLQIKRHREKLDVTTPKLIISMVFHPFSVRVYDHEGRLLTQDHPRSAAVFKGPRIIVNKKCPGGVPILGLGDLPGPIDRRGRLHRMEMQVSNEKGLKSHLNPQLVFPLFAYQGKDTAVGYFLDNPTSSLIDFRKADLGEFAMATDDGELDYYWIVGQDIDEVVQGFFTLVGNSTFPPRWSLEVMKGLEAPMNSKDFLKTYTPLREDLVTTSSVMVHQPKDQSTGFWDDQPGRMLKAFKRTDMIPHFMMEIDQRMPLEKLRKSHARRLKQSGGFLSTDEKYTETLQQNGYAYLDPFFEGNHQWLSERLGPLFSTGLRGIEVKDACMPWDRKDLRSTTVKCIQEIVAEDGESIEKLVHHVEARKLMAYMPNGLAKGLHMAQLNSVSEFRPLVISSAGYAGIQRYCVLKPLHGPMSYGDLPRFITRLLSLNVSGAPLLCCDLKLEPGMDQKFMSRLAYALAFVPLIRLHFSPEVNLEELHRADQFLKALNHVFEYRESWLPYLYQLMWTAHTKGSPILYPAVYFFPEWQEGYDLQDMYFVGKYILVAPHTSAAESREVHLPPGEWVHASTFTSHEGNSKVKVAFNDDPLPLFYREGAIVPRFDIRDPLMDRSVMVTVFPKPDSVTELEVYDDDGETKRYKTEEYSAIQLRLTSSHKGHVLKIARRQGRNNPSWTSYVFRFLRSRLDIQRVVYNRVELEYFPSKEELFGQKMGFHLDDEKELMFIKVPYEREGGVIRF